MTRKPTIHGTVSLKNKLKMMEKELLIVAQQSLARDLAAMDTDAKKMIQGGSRSGKTYKRKSITHQASAPGELPKTDRGELVAGFFFDIKKTAGKVFGKLSNRAKHAEHLEFKLAQDGGRPFMRPIFQKWAPRVQRNVSKAVKEELKRISRV